MSRVTSRAFTSASAADAAVSLRLTPEPAAATLVGVEPGERRLIGPQPTGRDDQNLSQPIPTIERNGAVAVDAQDNTDYRQISLAYLPPTARQTRAALAGAALLLLGFAGSAPFAHHPVPLVDGFIPALDAIIFVTDLITACLLLAHVSVTRSRALLALACGYLFSATIIIAHGLSSPGAISPTGNFGIPWTNFKIYLFWHLGLPTALFGYVWLRGEDSAQASARAPIGTVAACSVAGVLFLVGCIVWFSATDTFLHSRRTAAALIVVTMLVCAAALFVLWVFRRSALDQWLMVVTLALIVELAITSLLGGLLSLGFYTGRIFSLVTSTVVLTVLLAETARLYGRLDHANMRARAIKAEAELAHANRVATMGQLAASIAHEVNQPIAATLLNAGNAVRWLTRQPPDLEKTRQSIERSIDDGKRAADIVSRIRDFSKKAPARKQEFEINDAISEIMGLARVAMSKHGVSEEMQLAEGLPHILADKVQFQQVILNLIMNAVEALSELKEGSRELIISTGKAEADGVLVTVSDTGPGLSQAGAERLFEAFYTTKSSGLGMGLSICRSIVEAHGGRLWATPNQPRGAVFRVLLPIFGMNPS